MGCLRYGVQVFTSFFTSQSNCVAYASSISAFTTNTAGQTLVGEVIGYVSTTAKESSTLLE